MEQDHLNLVIVGHVDHGKSTLTGRLLYDTDSIPDSIIEDIKKFSNQAGQIEFSYLLDSLEEERERNITIDTTQTFFSTAKRRYTIIDAPGHREFLKNMITGASLADAAIVIVDASRGIEEQTKRHAFLLGLIGIKQIIVAINKMDLLDYSSDAFMRLSQDVKDFFAKIGITPRYIIPISAQQGINTKSAPTQMKWFVGPTLLNALDTITPPEPLLSKPLRFPVQDIYEGDERPIIVGRPESGELASGDRVTLFPGGKETSIRSIEVWQESRTKAVAGESIGVTFEPQVSVERGAVIYRGTPPTFAEKLNATIFWLGEEPYSLNETLTFQCATQEVSCTIEKIEERVNSSTLEVLAQNSDQIATTEVSKVQLRTNTAVAIENFTHIPELGRFVLRKGDDIVAGGIVRV